MRNAETTDEMCLFAREIYAKIQAEMPAPLCIVPLWLRRALISADRTVKHGVSTDADFDTFRTAFVDASVEEPYRLAAEFRIEVTEGDVAALRQRALYFIDKAGEGIAPLPAKEDR